MAIRRIAVLFLAFALTAGAAYAQKPTVSAPCIQCHEPAKDVIRGSNVGVSAKFGTIQVAVGKLVWVVGYDESTKVEGAKSLPEIPKDKEIAVRFSGDEKKPHAVSVAVKPPAELPADKLVSTAEMAKLTEKGPEKGKYVLIDSRPAPRFLEGHLPYAVSMPMPAFDKMKDAVLPKDKKALVIFYCAGVT